MRIDHVNTLVSGGASNAARRLHQGLLVAGVDSRFWTRPPRRNGPAPGDAIGYLDWSRQTRGPMRWLQSCGRIIRKLSQKIDRYRSLAGRPAGLEAFTSPSRECPTLYTSIPDTGEVVHLHWISKLIDHSTFFKSIPADIPVVWTLHDMNPFTGGCHFSSGCESFVTECRHCPQLGRPGANDLSNRNFAIKKQALEGLNLHVVSPSHWLEREARRSSLFEGARSFRTIHYGLDTSVFQPKDRHKARQQLGLSDDRFIIGFGADSLDVRRKGLAELLDALRQLNQRRDLLVLAFGSGEFPDGPSLPQIHHVGRVTGEENLAGVYAAMDMFVLPSLEDNSPQTGLEALACGVPVVGFDSGGISDYVLHGETGLLARSADSAGLSQQIESLLDAPETRHSMSVNGRQLIVQKFEQQQQTRAYIELYEKLLTERGELLSSRRAA